MNCWTDNFSNRSDIFLLDLNYYSDVFARNNAIFSLQRSYSSTILIKYIKYSIYLSCIVHRKAKTNLNCDRKSLFSKPLTNNMSWRKYLLCGCKIIIHYKFISLWTRWNIQMFVAGCLIGKMLARVLNREHTLIMRNYIVLKVRIQSNEDTFLPTAKYWRYCSVSATAGISIWNNGHQILRWFT